MIVGTCIQTVVTAEDSVAGGGLQLFGNSPFLLDRQVGETQSGIHDIGFCDSSRRAGANTERAGPAKIASGFIRVQGGRGQDFAQKEPRPVLS